MGHDGWIDACHYKACFLRCMLSPMDMYTHTYIIYLYLGTVACILYIYIYMIGVYLCIHTYGHMYIYMYSIYIYMYLCIYIYMYIYTHYTYVYIYIHNYIHIFVHICGRMDWMHQFFFSVCRCGHKRGLCARCVRSRNCDSPRSQAPRAVCRCFIPL